MRCGEKKGVFSKYSWPRLWARPCCKQILSWSVGTLDAQTPVRKAGGSAVWKPSWLEIQLLKCSALMGQLSLCIYWLVQAVLTYLSIAPWLLDTLQKLQSPVPVQSKVWTCHLERRTGKKEDGSGCSFTQRPWIWHSSGSSVPSPGQEQWTAQATVWLGRYLRHNRKQSQHWLYIYFPKQHYSIVFTTLEHDSRGME